MEHVWTVICRESVLDKRTNNLSLITTLESIRYQSDDDVDGIQIEFEVVSSWWRTNLNEPEKGNARIVIHSPSNEALLAPLNYEIDLTNFQRFRFQGRISGLPLRGSGIYRFITQIEIDSAWETVASTPLEIVRTDNQG